MMTSLFFSTLYLLKLLLFTSCTSNVQFAPPNNTSVSLTAIISTSNEKAIKLPNNDIYSIKKRNDVCALDTTQLKIIKVNGLIKYKDTNAPLLPGQRIELTTDLSYNSEDDYCIAIDQNKKLFVARLEKSSDRYTFKEVRRTQKARPGKILSHPAFQQYLKGRDLLILGGKMSIEVGSKEFPLDSAHFFYIKYFMGNDSIEINKILSSDSQHLIIIRDSLFKVDNQPISKDSTYQFSLHYFETERSSSLYINDFQPIFPDEETLKTEVGDLLEEIGKFAPRKLKVDIIQAYMSVGYGVPERENLIQWLKASFVI